MKNEQNISKEAQVLLKLIRIAIGTEPRRYFGELVEPFPKDIDWKMVIRLSYQNKVSALAVDGLKASQYNPYEGLNDTQTNNLKSILEPWYADVANIEQEYEYYKQIIQTICQILSAHGLNTIILKGASLSQYYPIPSHRGAGDIDIYIIDKNNNCAAKQADEIIQKEYSGLFHLMEHQNSYHTQYSFKGIIVENHYNIIGHFYNEPLETRLQSNLERLIVQNIKPIPDIECAYFPSATFNEIFLLRHIFSHCYFGEMTLRQFVDNHLFYRNNAHQIDQNKAKEIIEEANMISFAESLKSFIRTFICGSTTLPLHPYFNEVFEPKTKKSGVSNINHYFKDRGKIKFMTGEHWLPLTLRSCCHHLFAGN